MANNNSATNFMSVIAAFDEFLLRVISSRDIARTTSAFTNDSATLQ